MEYLPWCDQATTTFTIKKIFHNILDENKQF